MTMIDRREMLKAGAALGALAASPALAKGLAGAGTSGSGDAALGALFDTMFAEGLAQNPEGATQLGLDTGARAGLRSQLSIGDAAHKAMQRQLTLSQLTRLDAIDATTLSPKAKLQRDVVLYTRRSAAAAQRFDFGGSSYSRSPYVVSQITGSYQSTPSFLDTKHPIAGQADAEAYVARVGQFAAQLDADTAQMQSDAARGILPPDYLLDGALEQLSKTIVPADKAVIVQSLRTRGGKAGADAATIAAGEAAYTDQVVPALQRQLALVRELRGRASHDAGVWKFKEGPEFYAMALAATTTTRLTPEEVHKFGLDQAAQIGARLDGELNKLGMTKGSIGARMAALYKDPAQLYPNDDAGKAQAIAYCNERLAAIRTLLPKAFTRQPNYTFEVRRVPRENEAGAASAFSQSPSLDGKRPGLVYFNLHDSAEWPKFCLATTVFHEGLPGHQFEGGLALSNTDLPLILKTTGFSGYAEGWALYAEQLADELGIYDDDPLGRLGYLKFQMFRANRCVVDTGIHHFKWTREQAIQRFVENEGEAVGFATREVDRYTALPGQACSYKLGHSSFVKLRAKAQAVLGAKYDIKAFHDAVLGCGRVPLEILEQVGNEWIASVKA